MHVYLSGVKMTIDLIVFDFDGTLFDTSEDITKAMNFALNKAGLPLTNRTKVWNSTGDGTSLLIKRILGKNNKNLHDIVLNDFIEYHSLHYADYTKPMKGVTDVLERFKTKKMVILSNKYKEFIDKILKKFEIDKYFSAVYGKESFSKSKPHPYPLLYTIKKMKVTTQKTIFVGDSLNDVLISKNANVKCFIIPSCVTPIEKIEELKPYKILKNIKELVNFIK